MNKTHQSIYPLLLVLLTTFFSVNVFAMGLNQSENVFRFQQKLANKGNAYAQYKLATMYETGSGVDADIDQAKQWYQQASAKGVKAASDRNTYLIVKEQGFSKSEHQDWLNGVKVDAKARKVEAMHLLGQLYLKGLGVEKNLDKSLALLTYVDSSGACNVDSEISLIHDEINASKIAAQKQQTVNKKKAVPAKVIAEKATPKKTVPVKAAKKKQNPPVQKQAQAVKQKKVQAQAKVEPKQSKDQAMIEKKRRYEEVMAKIELEQRLINEQQAQVTGGSLASVDDEF